MTAGKPRVSEESGTQSQTKSKIMAFAGRLADASSAVVWISRALLMFMILAMSYEVVARYIFNRPTGFMDDLSALLFVGIVATGIAYTLKAGAHVRVDLVTRHLPLKAQRWLLLGTSVLSLIVCLLTSYYLYKEVLDQRMLGITSISTLYVRLWIPESILLAGFLLLAWELAREIFAQLRKGGYKVEEEIEQI